ncbi:MAG: electron transport complex subunit RsxC [Halanaerobiales bacterium]|nr:electron transport complex subunit RsxC [Halanaerobiales bacterium]
MSVLTFKQGIHPEYHKELTKDVPLREASRPKEIVVPLQQHIGAPLKPTVEKGDHVKRGQKIGDTDSFVAAPVHSSVSGTVKSIEKVRTPSGQKTLSVIIEADEEDVFDDSLKPNKDIDQLEPKEIIDIIREAGIVGLGGAMFPTHVKLSVPDDKNIDYFILNGIECEPFLNVDNRMMIERSEDIVEGMKLMMKAADVKKGIIGIEDNKPRAISNMKKAVENEENIEIKVFETKYPQGGEKMLIKAALGREVPDGGLPLDVGVIVNNISTAIAVLEAVAVGKPLIERTITITGEGISKPCNLYYSIGTKVKDLINEAGGYEGEPAKIILGGPMTGSAQHTTDVPTVKGTSGIIVLHKKSVAKFDPKPCIKCARCVDSCPMYLLPLKLSDLSQYEKYDELDEYDVQSCIECGSCSYICPADRPLLDYIRIGKMEDMKLKKSSQ